MRVVTYVNSVFVQIECGVVWSVKIVRFKLRIIMREVCIMTGRRVWKVQMDRLWKECRICEVGVCDVELEKLKMWMIDWCF